MLFVFRRMFIFTADILPSREVIYFILPSHLLFVSFRIDEIQILKHLMHLGTFLKGKYFDCSILAECGYRQNVGFHPADGVARLPAALTNQMKGRSEIL